MSRGNIFDLLNTPFVVTDWFIAIAISLWYIGSGSAIGNFYAIMGLIAPAALFMLLFFTSKTDIPFPYKTTNIWTGAFLFGSGFIVFFFGGLIKLTQYFLSPYALYSQQAYTTFVVAGNEQAQLINIGIIPPIVEEAFWAVMTLVGFLIVFAILQGYGQNTKSTLSRIAIWAGGIAMAAITFAAFHIFNPDVYRQAGQFISAAGFRIAVVIIGFGLGVMEFFIGAHMGNNMTAIITSSPQGVEIFSRAFFTNYFGIGFLIYLLLRFGIMFYGIANKKINYGAIFKFQ